MSTFRVLSWSMGNDKKFSENYLNASKQKDEDSPKAINLTTARNKIAKSAFANIKENAPDIMFLQEVDIKKISDWIGSNFAIKTDSSNTALAYGVRFKLLDSKIDESRSFTIYSLEDQKTKKIYTVASINISKVNLEDSVKIDPNERKENQEFTTLLSSLKEMAKDSDETIIGLNANTINDYNEKFAILEQAGFHTNDTDSLRGVSLNSIFASKVFNFLPDEHSYDFLNNPLENPSDKMPKYEKLEYISHEEPKETIEDTSELQEESEEEISVYEDVENIEDSESEIDKTQVYENPNQSDLQALQDSQEIEKSDSDLEAKKPTNSLRKSAIIPRKVSFELSESDDEMSDSEEQTSIPFSPPPSDRAPSLEENKERKDNHINAHDLNNTKETNEETTEVDSSESSTVKEKQKKPSSCMKKTMQVAVPLAVVFFALVGSLYSAE